MLERNHDAALAKKRFAALAFSNLNRAVNEVETGIAAPEVKEDRGLCSWFNVTMRGSACSTTTFNGACIK
jgi:hypothetical protein